MTYTRIFVRILNFPRKTRKCFYTLFNKYVLWINGVKYGKNLQIYNRFYFHKDLTANIEIGDNFKFSSGESFNPLCRNMRGCIYASKAAHIKIGNNVGISSASIWSLKAITIGNNVNIGGDCIILDSDCHSLNWEIRRKEKNNEYANCAPITIEDDVLVGARCIILKGVTIGARSIIAAGSVVTKSIPSDCVAGGNPCKIIRSLV